MPVRWYGKQVSAKLQRAQIAGVNETMGACVAHAKRNHDWQNRTGTLEGAIDIDQYAHAAPAGGVRGTWGTRDVRYAKIHELGGTIMPKTAKALVIPDGAGGVAAVVASVTIPKRPYLRPAADTEYPKLAARIRRNFEAGPSA